MNIEKTILKIISKVSSVGISDVHLQSYIIKDLNLTALEFTSFEEPLIHTVEDIIKQVRLKL